MNHFAKIAEKLSAYELDGMLLTCEANRFYASGFHSTGTDGVALVTREGNFYFTDSRYIEAAHNKVQDAEIAMTDAAHPYVDLINAAMEKTHVQKLGFEDAYMTVADYRHYSEKLHCQLVPATELLISLRQSKDEEEIQRMIAAQRIAEGALDQIVKEIKPGVTEKEIAARLQYLMLAGGAENMSFDPIVASGPNGSMPHAVPTDRKIQDGDFVTMDFGCIYQGYCSDMTRTVAVGHVTEEMEKVYNVVLQAQLAGIAAAKAGATGHDVDAAARKVIEDAGYGPYFGHSFGHSVGVEIHESPNATPANNNPLPLGAAVSAEPGIYLPGRFGVRIEDVVVLQEGGCQDITLAKKDLLIVDKNLVEKGHRPFSTKRDIAPNRAFRWARSPSEHTLSAQSVFCDVHAAAKNGLHLIHGLRAVNSARLFNFALLKTDFSGKPGKNPVWLLQ